MYIYIYIYNTVMYIEPAGRRAAFQGLLRVRWPRSEGWPRVARLWNTQTCWYSFVRWSHRSRLWLTNTLTRNTLIRQWSGNGAERRPVSATPIRRTSWAESRVHVAKFIRTSLCSDVPFQVAKLQGILSIFPDEAVDNWMRDAGMMLDWRRWSYVVAVAWARKSLWCLAIIG